jgi:hypothetical protein
MSDFDTRRIGEVAQLEEMIVSLQKQVAGYKMIAERWQPRVTSVIDNDQAKISMTFSGKTMTATYPIKNLQGVDLISATTSVLQTLSDALIMDSLRPVVMPEVKRMIDAAESMTQVSKW